MQNINEKALAVTAEVSKAVLGKPEVVLKIMMAILARGHVLIEDIPGVGKTTLAQAFARAMDLTQNRVQFTPDVLPSDIVGFSLYQKETGKFVYHPGAVMCNLFLADEINRTSARTQSALLEVMEESAVTVDGVTRVLPQPFTVFATENPVGSVGTQMLPESQLDRFMVCVVMGYPDTEAEREILTRQPRHGLLGVKDLHAVQHKGLPAVQCSFDAVECVGLHRCVGGVQTVGGIGGGQVGGFGKAVRIGDEPGADAAARIRYGQGHAGQRRGLPGSRGIDQYTAFGHIKTPPAPHYANAHNCVTMGAGGAIMVYLSGFRFPDRAQEANYMAFSPRARQTCYDSYYPFGLFEGRTLPELDFLEITILYGGNGSGKTTLLNVMADALRLYRRAEYNRTPFFDDYARLCEPRTMRPIPTGSMILTSDDVFDYMLDLRALNDGVDTRREQMFADYNDLRREKFQMHGMKDYDRLKQVSAARRYSQSQMARRTLPANVRTRSNGESALAVFSERIRENALYLLDEPENSLSPERQLELARFLHDSARFYNCQFVIATHSPFLLAMPGARIYDLDSEPIATKRWTELENVRATWEFFQSHKDEFK